MIQDKPKRTKRHWPWVTLAILAAGLAATAIWWIVGSKIWTDGRAIRAAAGQANVRDVLWDPPRSLGPDFESDEHEYEPYLSPDGTEFYFVRNKPGHNADIYVSYRKNNQWTPPTPLDAVNSPYDDLGPRLTPDGKFLLFYSDRPGGFGGYDIWASRRTADGWDKPFNLGPQINSEYNEFSPDPTPDGKHLIFATNRKAAQGEQKQAWRATIRQTENGDYDLWIADLDPNGSTAWAPTTLPTTAPAAPLLAFHPATEIANVNTPYMEGASCMSPAGDFLYFASNRPGGFGKFDIYRSRIDLLENGQLRFAKPENAGPQINTADNETDPSLALNGFRLYLSSDRGSEAGVYRLLVSDSREVYPIYPSRPLPHLGQSFWLMLISLLVLIPLLLFLRGWDDRKLGILQKCLLLSLLVHALICFGLNFMNVTTQAYHFVRQEMGVELPVSLTAPREMDVGYAIRRQSTSDLPVAGAAPQDLAQSQTPVETVATAGPVDVNVPAAHIQPGPDAIVLQTPATTPPAAKPDAVAVAPAAPREDSFDLRASAPAQISQTETMPQVSAVDARMARPAPSAIEQLPPVSIQIAANPSEATRTAVSSVESPSPARAAVQVAENDPQRLALAAGPLGETPTLSTAAVNSRQQANEISLTARIANAANQALVSVPLVIDHSQASPAAHPVEARAMPSQPEGIARGAVSDLPGGFRPQAGPVAEAVAAPGTADLFSAPAIGAPTERATTARIASTKADAPVLPETAVAAAPQSGAQTSARPIDTAVPTAPVASAGQSSIDKTPVMPTLARGGALVTDPTQVTSPATPGAHADAADLPQVSAITGSSASPKVGQATRVALATEVASPSTRPTDTSNELRPAMVAAAIASSPNVPASAKESRNSLASSAEISRRPVQIAQNPLDHPSDFPVSTIAGALDSPAVAFPKGIAPPGAGGVTRVGGGAEKSATSDAVAFAAARTDHGPEGGGAKNVHVEIGTGPISPDRRSSASGNGADPLEAHPRAAELAAASVAPDVTSILPARNDIGPTLPSIPDSPFRMRASEVHRPIIEQLGGTKESESAVDRGLAYLASVQEEDGRWSFVNGSRRPTRNSGQRAHDSACTGLSILAFLAQDHRPDNPGPYQQTVSRGLEFLLAQQLDDGDLRGPRSGGGADNANMYDHAIATLALAEAALMTRDPRYTAAANQGAQFIVRAQNPQTGGWRYIPGEQGDSSVFGWQIMALHSAEQLGFEIPASTRRGAIRYIALASHGAQHMLAGYQPFENPTAPMTAEITFSRMLLGQQLTDDESDEVATFLARQPPQASQADIYYWYYGSLCMMQMQSDAWKYWNTRTRDMLVRTQRRDVAAGGYWDNMKWSDRGGRVFSTAMATLTLEVYYRYMPLQKKAEEAITAREVEAGRSAK